MTVPPIFRHGPAQARRYLAAPSSACTAHLARGGGDSQHVGVQHPCRRVMRQSLALSALKLARRAYPVFLSFAQLLARDWCEAEEAGGAGSSR